MRLLKRDKHGNLSFTTNLQSNIPPYAILSHTWGEEEDEVTYQDILRGLEHISAGARPFYSLKTGYRKVEFCMKQAESEGYEYIWIDTCCINRDSLSELDESINSMFRWYSAAAVCYVYPFDVPCLSNIAIADWHSAFCASRWFTRGWTLQELVAPTTLMFFSQQGELLGSRTELAHAIHSFTSIPETVLTQSQSFSDFSVEIRFSWAANRRTKKEEDRVYSLIGLLGVNLDIRYGRGLNIALDSLREAVTKKYHSDLSLCFAAERPAVVSAYPNLAQRLPVSQPLNEVVHKQLAFSYSEHRRDVIASATITTGTWILQHPEFQTWRDRTPDNEHNRVLWIKGNPGSGKSTLMKLVDEHLFTEGEATLLAFYFNGRGQELGRTVEGMYRSLICTLLVSGEDCSTLFRSAFAERLRRGDTVSWSLETLQDLLRKLIRRSTKTEFIIMVDALDECERSEVRDMIYFFEDLAYEYMNTSGKRVLICFASRHHPVTPVGRGLQIIIDREPEHILDIKTYILRRLPSRPDLDAEGLIEELLRKAQGSFIWTILAMRALYDQHGHGLRHDALQILRQLPGELRELYHGLMLQDDTQQEAFVLCMQFVLLAQTSVNFSKLQSALRIRIPDLASLLDSVSKDNDAEARCVTSLTRGLVEVTHNRRVQFIHETVRDYLFHNGLSTILSTSESYALCQSHDDIRALCDQALGAAIIAGDRAFTQYAQHYIMSHAEAAAEHIDQTSFLLMLQASESKRIQIVSNQLRHDRYHSYDGGCSLLSILVHHAHPRLLEDALEAGVRGCIEDPHGKTALRLASQDGRVDLVRLLLRYQSRGKGSGDHCAVALLAIPLSTSSPPELARSIEILSLLLTHGAEVNAHSEYFGNSALHNAAYSNAHEAVSLLLTHGADVNIRDRNGRAPLHHAISVRAHGVASLLLTHGADVNARDHEGESPLHGAVSSSAGNVASLLSSRHVNDNSQRHEITPLLYEAAWGRHRKVMSLLLTHGADVNARDHKGTSPLHVAALEDAYELAILLLKHGADVNERDAGGGTPLHLAVSSGHLKLVALFLDHKANCNIQNFKGVSPVHLAASAMLVEITRLLLTSGADPNARTYSGASVLEMAVTSAARCPGIDAEVWNKIIGLLLDYGANARAQGFHKMSTCKMTAVQWRETLISNAKRLTPQKDDEVEDCRCSRWSIVLEEDRAIDECYAPALERLILLPPGPHGLRSVSVAKLLIDHGADLDTPSTFRGMTPLLWAVSENWTEMVELLLDEGADIQAMDSEGNNAFMLAMEKPLPNTSRLQALLQARVEKP